MEEKNVKSNIVYDPEAANLKEIATDPVRTHKENPIKDKPTSGIVYDKDANGPDIIEDNVVEIDLEDYTQYLGSDIYMPEEGGIETLNQSRAIRQPWHHQARNMVGQAVVGEIIGGTIEGLGYLLDVGSAIDYANGNEREWGNFMTEAGQSLRTWGQENMAIHQTNPGAFNPSDSGWWFSNGVSVASTLSMMIPSMAASKALGFLGKTASKGAGVINKSLDIAANMGKKASWMTEGITQAVVSRHIENSMEASGTFKDQKAKYLGTVNPKTGVKFTEEEAGMLAGEAAASNYRAGWAMLLQDIPQYLALGRVFNPNTRKMERAFSKAAEEGKNIGAKAWRNKLTAGAGTFASEGFEESYQYYIAERGKALSDLQAGLIDQKQYDNQMSNAIGSDEMMTSAFFGGLGGNLFQAAGSKVSDLKRGKSGRAADKKYEEEYSSHLKNRAQHFAAIQIKLSDADQENDTQKRDIILEELMTDMAINSLDNNKFDQHMEMLEGVSKMSKEEQASFEKEHGIELNRELFGKYTPKAIETSNKIKDIYLKHLDKNERGIASKLTRNDLANKNYLKANEAISSEIAKIKKEIPFYDVLSDRYKHESDLKIKLKALDFVHKHKNASLRKASPAQKKIIQELLDDNLKERIEIIKEISDYKKTDERTPTEKYKDRRRDSKKKKNGLTNSINELAQLEANKIIHEDAIAYNQSESALMKTKEYQKEFKKNKVLESLKDKKTEEEVRNAIEKVNTTKDLTEEEKEIEIKALEERSIAIKAENKLKEEKANQEASEAALLEKVAKAEAEKAATKTNANIAKAPDNFEDEFADEEVDFEESEHQKEVVLNDSKNHNSIEGLVDHTDKKGKFRKVTSESWDEWVENGKSKIGEEVEISIGEYGYGKDVDKAISDFKEGKITDHTFRYLPLKASRVKDPTASTELPFEINGNESFNEKELPVRAGYIKALSKGKVITRISATYGGQLNRAPLTDDGLIPENNVLDLLPIGGDIAKVELMLTNDLGQLIDSFKEHHKDYLGRSLSVVGTKDDDNNEIPYKGGVFINVKKADGTSFPLKLNLSKHTREEAETVADLLIAVAVTKELKYKTRLSMISEELRNRIKENHPAELKALGKDPSVQDIIDIFAYVSAKTKGKSSELRIGGNAVMFGNRVKSNDNLGWVQTDNVNDPAARERLISFIQNEKRRQFNLKKWNSSPKYKQYIFDSKMLSTDTQINEPLFKNSEQRTTKVYFESVKEVSISSPTVPKVSTKSLDQASRISRSEKSVSQNNGVWAASYFNSKGEELKFSGKTKDEAISKASAKYELENIANFEGKSVPYIAPPKPKVDLVQKEYDILSERYKKAMDKTSSAEEAMDEDNDQLEYFLELSKNSKNTNIRSAAKKILEELSPSNLKEPKIKPKTSEAEAKIKKIQDKRRVVKKKNPFELNEDFGKKDLSLEDENVNDDGPQAIWGLNEKTLSEEDMDIAKNELVDNDNLSEKVDIAISSSKKEDLKETAKGKEYINDDDLDFDEDDFGPDCFLP